MAICIRSIVRRLDIKNLAWYSTATKTIQQIPDEPIPPFRTLENDPKNHDESHLYRYYAIHPEHRKQIFELAGITNKLEKQFEVFGETCIMVRKPAIEIISYLKQADYSKPVNKYVLYGEYGSGKTCTLLHILHYGWLANKLLVHVPFIKFWFTFPQEYAPSTRRPNCWDLPIDGAAWLVNFKAQNQNLLKTSNLKLTKDYEWGPHESTKAGSTFLELIDFGINRIKYSNDIIIALVDEIKIASNAGICNTLVVIEGFNGLYTDYTRIKNDLKKFVPASQVTLTEALLKITESNWRNGAIVLTVDQKWHYKRRESIYPRYLLSKEGFEHLDPFIPIQVDNYNEQEFESVMEYFKERKWIRDVSPSGLQEIRAICKSNPLSIAKYCASL